MLTAAHCAGNPLTMLVRTNSTLAFSGGEASAVTSATFAPGYARGIENDLAILTLKTPTSAPAIQPATAAEDAALRAARRRPRGRRFREPQPIAGRKQQIGLLTAADVSVPGSAPSRSS